jgi:hypothetical protein
MKLPLSNSAAFMTTLIRHVPLTVLLALGACNQTAQSDPTASGEPASINAFFGPPGTAEALTVAGVAASYDPTGASSFVVAKATHAALVTQAARARAERERSIAREEARIRKISDPDLRAVAEQNLALKKEMQRVQDEAQARANGLGVARSLLPF